MTVCATMALGGLALLAAGCASRASWTGEVVPPAAHDAGVVAPGSRVEAAVLEQLPRLPAAKPTQVAGVTVLAGETYYAASGRRCRPVAFQGGDGASGHRLACSDGERWFYVPPVFVEGYASRGEP